MFYLFHYNVMNLFSFRCIAMSDSWFPSNLSIIAHSLLLFNHDYDIIAKVIRFPLQLRGEIIKYRRNASLSLSMPKKWHTTKLLIGAIWTVVGAVAQLLGRKTDGVVGGTHMVRQLAHQRVTVDLVRVVLAVAVAIAHPGLADAASWWDHNMENLQPVQTIYKHSLSLALILLRRKISCLCPYMTDQTDATLTGAVWPEMTRDLGEKSLDNNK